MIQSIEWGESVRYSTPRPPERLLFRREQAEGSLSSPKPNEITFIESPAGVSLRFDMNHRLAIMFYIL
jgi:hypothetical protein